MLTLTQTVIDAADCHTSLFYFQPAVKGPLPLGNSATYNSFYESLAAPAPVTYQDQSGQAGSILNKFSTFFRKNNYWSRFFASGQIAAYPSQAWEFALPVVCSLKLRINFVLNPKFNFAVKPFPSILLYPFGWSGRLSLLLQGPHKWEDLAEFNQYIFSQKAFSVDPDPKQGYSVPELFEKFAEGVRADAFGGLQTKDFSPNDTVLVTTVLEKNSGTLSPSGLSETQKQTLMRVVKPKGPAPKETLKNSLYDLDQNTVKYVVMHNFGRFIWMEDLLDPVGRNYQHLRCYHNNTFNSLVHARHLRQLLTQVAKLKTLEPPLSELTDKALETLATPSDYYENASLRKFLSDPAVLEARAKMAKFNAQPGAP